jgi:hypothetical protein
MLNFKNKVLTALSLCGSLVLSTPAPAQTVDEKNTAAGLTLQNEPGNTPAGEQPAEAASPQLGHGTKAQAEHSAEATAHKTVNDPNNQLGTSLQGRTRPVADAGAGSQNNTALTSTPEAGAQ